MRQIKRYAIAIAGVLAAIGATIFWAVLGARRTATRKQLTDLAGDLADENAARARDQADMHKRELDARAKAEIEAADAKAREEAAHAAVAGDLSGYLNRRPRA